MILTATWEFAESKFIWCRVFARPFLALAEEGGMFLVNIVAQSLAGVGGTSIYLVENLRVTKHKIHIINNLHFATTSKTTP